MYLFFLLFIGSVAMTTNSCLAPTTHEPVPSSPQPAKKQVEAQNKTPNFADLQPGEQVSFKKHLLPLLTSNTAGKVYKCTTCHAHMISADGINSIKDVQNIVEALRSRRMPISGDPVPEEEIRLFELWALQGFPE